MKFKYGFIFLLSWLALLWERFWNRFWLATSVILFFSALSLFNLLVFFGPLGHIFIIGIFAVTLALSLIRTAYSFSFPSRDDVERRIEKVSLLPHRPLETLHDKPVEGLSEDSLGLWQTHLQKTALYLDNLRIYKPQSDVSHRDRWGIRYAAVVFLVIGLIAARGDAIMRLHQAFALDMTALIGRDTASLDLWITPPEYTHEAAVFLATSKQGWVAHDILEVPAGSILKLRISGFRHTPRLHYAGQSYLLTAGGPENFTFEMPLQQSGILTLTSWFSTLGQWPISVLQDAAPEVSIQQIEATPRAATKITYKAHDDHGITKIAGLVTVQENGSEPFSFDIPATDSLNPLTYAEDLAAHPSAGSPATMTLIAEDSIGHKTISAPMDFILPERIFTNPLAQRVIAERKILLKEKNPLVYRVVSEKLAEIADNPASYKGDPLIFMSLASAAKRLMYDGSDSAVQSVIALLWDVALKLEDGGLSLSQQELRDSLQKLSEALHDKNTTKQQLQALLDDVQQKMRQYIQTLAREMQQRLQQGKKMPVISPELAQKFMKNIDLGKLLEEMRQMAQSNSRDNLQKMADSLKNAIDNIDMKKFDQMQEKQMQAMESLQTLQEIIHRQQALFDKTNKSDDPADAKGEKQEQSALRQQLGGVVHKLGDVMENIPDNFAKADQGMKQSTESFSKGQPRESLPYQKTALDELQKGLDSVAKQMAESMQQSMLSFGMSPGGDNYGEGYDPLGRPNGKMDESDIKIPTEKEQRRVQEIIEELRNRSNEPNRTKVERDYIDRLLDQF